MNNKILLGSGIFIALITILLSFSSNNIVVQSVEQQSPIVASATSTSTPVEIYYSVAGVVDGDTVKIDMNGGIVTLRLIGLDTPETVDPRKPVQCFGKEASNKAKGTLLGKKVRIEKDPTQGEYDKYNRVLAYIYLEDGVFYNQYMIEEGYAHEYTYATPYKYQAEFKAAQKMAQTLQKGLWSSATCNGNTKSSPTATSTGMYHTSSYSTSKYYYTDVCDEWKSLDEKYLKSFNSLEELLAVYPTKTQSPQCE